MEKAVCNVCEEEFASNAGLSAHTRFKHLKNNVNVDGFMHVTIENKNKTIHVEGDIDNENAIGIIRSLLEKKDPIKEKKPTQVLWPIKKPEIVETKKRNHVSGAGYSEKVYAIYDQMPDSFTGRELIDRFFPEANKVSKDQTNGITSNVFSGLYRLCKLKKLVAIKEKGKAIVYTKPAALQKLMAKDNVQSQTNVTEPTSYDKSFKTYINSPETTQVDFNPPFVSKDTIKQMFSVYQKLTPQAMRGWKSKDDMRINDQEAVILFNYLTENLIGLQQLIEKKVNIVGFGNWKGLEVEV